GHEPWLEPGSRHGADELPVLGRPSLGPPRRAVQLVLLRLPDGGRALLRRHLYLPRLRHRRRNARLVRHPRRVRLRRHSAAELTCPADFLRCCEAPCLSSEGRHINRRHMAHYGSWSYLARTVAHTAMAVIQSA